jgi:hypothetical protein
MNFSKSAGLVGCVAVAGLFLLACSSGQAAAATVGIELNKLEPAGTNCRATLVITNGTETAFQDLLLDLVIFDQESIVAKRVAVDVAPLPAGKTSVKTFDISEIGCDTIARVLLNDVTSCGQDKPCLPLIDVTSRASAPFFK